MPDTVSSPETLPTTESLVAVRGQKWVVSSVDPAPDGDPHSGTVVTLQGGGGAISGAEPAAAFAGISGVGLWHWPSTQRERERAKAHAKLAAADRRVLLVSSANLTQSGVADNIEAGLLVRGGEAPRRIAEHVAELRTRGVLAPLQGGERP